METKQCKQCKVTRTLNRFIGERVKYTNTCDLCRNTSKKCRNKKKNLILIVENDEQKCNSCFKIKKIDRFKSKTNNEIIKTCLECRDRKNKYKKKKFGWNDIEINKAKKAFDKKYKFFVLKPIIKWSQKIPYKICTKCKKEKEFDQFISNRYEFTEVSTCLDCRDLSENRLKCNKIAGDNHLNKLRLHLNKLKKEKGPCVQCGENDKRVLQFDHIDESNKIKGVGDLRSIEKMNSEAEKCQILCRMCHTKKSIIKIREKYINFEKDKAIKRNQEYVNKIKMNIGECDLCEKKVEDHIPECFDFDHLNPDEKIQDVSDLVHGKYSIKKIAEEIKKCRLLCGNCHVLHTLKQRNIDS